MGLPVLQGLPLTPGADDLTWDELMHGTAGSKGAGGSGETEEVFSYLDISPSNPQRFQVSVSACGGVGVRRRAASSPAWGLVRLSVPPGAPAQLSLSPPPTITTHSPTHPPPHHPRLQVWNFVRNPWFDRFILLCIGGNCIELAIYDPLAKEDDGSTLFSPPFDVHKIFEVIFLVIFTLEVGTSLTLALGFASGTGMLSSASPRILSPRQAPS